MDNPTGLPGTSRHQQLLESILDYYMEDTRILAILLFGSLGRGDWDEYSDLDLDIIMVDNAAIDARLELANLCASIKHEYGLEALIMADTEEGDVVLSNLLEFSIRYHVLADTKPAILDSMRLLSGTVTLEEIRAAANQQYVSAPLEMTHMIDQCIRYALQLHNAILRQRLWMSLELLHHIKDLLMSLYGLSHGADRSLQYFDAHASPELRKLLANLTPPAELKPVKDAFSHTLLLLEDHLDSFTNGQYELSEAQTHILLSLSQLDRGTTG